METPKSRRSEWLGWQSLPQYVDRSHPAVNKELAWTRKRKRDENDHLKEHLPRWAGDVPHLGLIPEDPIDLVRDPEDIYFRCWKTHTQPNRRIEANNRALLQVALSMYESEDSSDSDETCLDSDVCLSDLETFPIEEEFAAFEAQVDAFDAETEWLQSAVVDEDSARDFVLFRESQW
jgi:hypothetical protein